MVKMTFDESDLRSLLDREPGTDRDSISCEEACRYAYQLERGWYVEDIASCESTIDPVVANEPTTPRGEVRCKGTGIEDFCD